ncbi:MAG: radical SAM protein [Dehalobacterium sp.]
MSRNQGSIRYADVMSLLRGRVPGQLVLQYTDHCNAACPQCGMRVTANFPRSKLSVNETKRIIEAAAAKGIKALSFTGGEPFLFIEELIGLIRYAGEVGIPYIRTGTNGYIFMHSDLKEFPGRMHRLAEQLAGTQIRNFWISLDSADPSMHEEMRGLPGVIRGIEKALPIFHEYGIYPAANLGINRNIGGKGAELNPDQAVNDPQEYCHSVKDALRKFYRFIINLGFTMVNACYPMSLESQETEELRVVYGANSVDQVVKFSLEEKLLLFKALYDVIPEYRKLIRIFSPRASLYALIHQYQGSWNYGRPCRGGVDFFYVDAKDCSTYPCGYRGNENLGKFWDLDISGLNPDVDCRKCDWECFRDPSELFGPVLEFFTSPSNIVMRFMKDPEYRRVWMEDLVYYKKCDFFNGRKPKEFLPSK